jgi:hypothetical protein
MKNSDKHKNYDRAIVLIQNQVQLFWLVFGAFLITETMILGGIISTEKGNLWTFFGAIFGLLLCIPWWGSFRYNHKFYELRMAEAREFEPKQGNFFNNGKRLIEGKIVDLKKTKGLLLTGDAMRPSTSIKYLIILYIVAYLLIIGWQVYLYCVMN